ncbi:hypothetical protein [Leptolyngbya sp. FACHB-261]|uniref:hypothetical protein n=1 Tax=Leptolyngbya sp. FACHB-261 TaxID=2692806 RepID=UPI001686706C|nr:hypothetical protein [Leptolyngbya sp. FACHB-261]MBD2103789.1 hypothetical protein [Leptolyngbya sp. FACHB-261]
MVRKRSRFKTHTILATCPHRGCSEPLRRLNSQRHYVFAEGVEEIMALAGQTRKKATFTAQLGQVVDRKFWLEEFFCYQHGRMWLAVYRSPEGKHNVSLPATRLWQRTTGTVDPEHPNPSIGEYTQRMSRCASLELRCRYGS